MSAKKLAKKKTQTPAGPRIRRTRTPKSMLERPPSKTYMKVKARQISRHNLRNLVYLYMTVIRANKFLPETSPIFGNSLTNADKLDLLREIAEANYHKMSLEQKDSLKRAERVAARPGGGKVVKRKKLPASGCKSSSIRTLIGGLPSLGKRK